jgi:predicted dehydrogenase
MGRLLRAGWLSTIYAITSRRAGPFPARIRDVGVTVDLGTHDVDMLSWIAGERPIRVYAETAQRIHATHEDLTFGLMHFPSGATGFLDVDWLTPAKRRSLMAVGEEGMFELDYLTQRLTFTRSNVERPLMIAGYATTFSGDVAEIPSSAWSRCGPSSTSSSASCARATGRTYRRRRRLWAVASPMPC